MNEAIDRLNSILNDTIILRMDFSIESLGSEIEKLTEYSSSDLVGQSLLSICADNRLPSIIKGKLNEGYFSNMPGSILIRSGSGLNVVFSGFYLGLISDINGFIVLKVRVSDNANHLKRELSKKCDEIDSFIYRAAHELRGPLATIKGLVNLLKMRKDNFEVDELTSLIDLHANKLDDRLFKLLYMSDLDYSREDSNNTLRFSVLESMLNAILANNCHLDNVSFNFNSSISEVTGVNESRSYQLISNLLLYILSLPMISVDKENILMINIDVTRQQHVLEFKMSSFGFMANQKVQSVVNCTESLYDDLLINPFLFNYYVAQKRARELQASIEIEFYEADKQVIKLLIPIKRQEVSAAMSIENKNDSTSNQFPII